MANFQEILKRKGMKIPEPKNKTPEEPVNTPPKEPVNNEPVNTPPKEPVNTPPKEPVNEPPKPDNPTPNQFDWSQVGEEVIFSHLTEKAGREIKSYQDLMATTVEKEVEKIVPRELKPEVDAFNKFHEETGRGFNDFMQIQKDWSNESEDTKLRAYLAEQHPGLPQEDINFLFEDTYGIPAKLEGEDYTAQELSANASAIRKAEIFRKQDAIKATQFFEDNKQKYLTPMEQKQNELTSQTAAGREAWANSVNAALDSVNGIDQDGFNYSFKGKEDFGKAAASIEDLLGRYKDDQGRIDHSKLIRTLMAGEQIGDILGDYKNHVEASVTKDQLRDKANPSDIKTNPQKVTSDKGAFDAKQHLLDTIHKNHGTGNFKK